MSIKQLTTSNLDKKKLFQKKKKQLLRLQHLFILTYFHKFEYHNT